MSDIPEFSLCSSLTLTVYNYSYSFMLIMYHWFVIIYYLFKKAENPNEDDMTGVSLIMSVRVSSSQRLHPKGSCIPSMMATNTGRICRAMTFSATYQRGRLCIQRNWRTEHDECSVPLLLRYFLSYLFEKVFLVTCKKKKLVIIYLCIVIYCEM